MKIAKTTTRQTMKTRLLINLRNEIASFVLVLDQCTCIGAKVIFVLILFVYSFTFADLYR